MDTLWKIVMFTEDSEHIDSADDAECAESVLYGDLSDHDGRPRIIQIALGDEGDRLAEQMDYFARINADCFGIPLDTIERVLV